MAAIGEIVYRGSSLWKRLVGNTTTTRKFLRQVGDGSASAAPAWDQVTDADLSTSDVTTNDVSTSKHGFAPKAPNDTTKFLRGDATWAVPAGGGGSGALDDLTDVTITTPSTDDVLKYDGTGWVNGAAPGGGGGDFTWVVKPSDESRLSNTTLTADTDLLMAIGTAGTYFIEVFLLLQCSTTADWKFSWSGPAGSTVLAGHPGRDNGQYWINAANATAPASMGTGPFTHGGAGNAVGVNGLIFYVFVIAGGTAGNVNFNWAQNTTDGAVSNTVKAGSFLRWKKIA